MAYFQTKIGWEQPKKWAKKKKSFRWVLTCPRIENSKKIAKKLKKLKKTIMVYFQAKIRWEKLTKSENKKIKKSFQWVPTLPGILNFKKTAKKFKKLNNTIIASFQAKIGWEWPKKRGKKNRSDEFLLDPG